MLACSVSLAACVALAGCAAVPIDELLGSTAIVAELPREDGALVEAARFSAGRLGELPPGDWGRFIVSPFATKSDYRLVDASPGVVLEGRADGSASGFYRRVRFDPARHPLIEWRWRVLQTPAAGVDPRVPARDDSPARVIIAFHGDVAKLDIGERFTLRLYTALTGEKMPYAIIMYTWSSDAPVGTITANDQTGKIQTIVVESGGRTGEWRDLRRNVLEDYRRAFGEEPWDIVAVGVMTDTSNTRAKARTQFGDITFLPAP